MKEILATWVVYQLIVIGISGVIFLDQLHNGTYKCDPDYSKASWLVATVPLAWFLQDSNYEDKFCGKD